MMMQSFVPQVGRSASDETGLVSTSCTLVSDRDPCHDLDELHVRFIVGCASEHTDSAFDANPDRASSFM